MTFKNMGLVRRHMMVKHRGVIRKCPCGMQFRALTTYEIHFKTCNKIPKDPDVLNVPPPPRPMIPCSIESCLEEFTHKISLIQHLEVCHGIEDTNCRFKCPTCRKRFLTQEKCDDHVENSHSSEKPRPHVCLICGARFLLGWHLKGHHKTVHSDDR